MSPNGNIVDSKESVGMNMNGESCQRDMTNKLYPSSLNGDEVVVGGDEEKGDRNISQDTKEKKDETATSGVRCQHRRQQQKKPLCSQVKKFLENNIEFKFVKFCQLLCGIYILVVTFTYTGSLGVFGGARDPDSGFIIDPSSPSNTERGVIEYVNPLFKDDILISRAIVASSNAQMVLLGLSRFSGYFMYPAIISVFWTKLRATQSFISKTPLHVFCSQDTHRLHVYCGWIIVIDGCLHTTFHLTRWALQGNLRSLLTTHPSGITGLIVIISTCIIVFPMTVFKQYLNFEMRKYAHYLFWIFCIAMAFHAPFHSFPNGGFCAFIFPALLLSYSLDSMYVKFFMSERINTVDYKVLGQAGVQLTMPVSQRFQDQIHSGGFGYVMLPWVDKYQWHAFSLYENPHDPSCRHMFIAKAGDWTSKVHRKAVVCTNTSRPLWISGPFPSPYNNAIDFDNMILVASGIGITPALSAIEANRDYRRINLIWAVREASMLVFFLENAKFDEKGLNLIFYTGKEALPETIENFHAKGCNAHVKIIKERPKLSHLIPNIIAFVDKGRDVWNVGKKKGTNTVVCPANPPNTPPTSHCEFDYDFDSLSSSASGVDSIEEEDDFMDLEGIQKVGSDDYEFKYDCEHEENEEWTRPLVPNAYECVRPGFRKESGRRGVFRTTSISDLSGGFKDTWKTSLMPRVWQESIGTDTRDYVKSTMATDHKETWGLLFCGGRNKLLEALVKESKDLGIPLHEEAFDW